MRGMRRCGNAERKPDKSCSPHCRALGEYAASSNAASDQEAKQLVDQAFLTLQNYDFELFQAIRTQQPVPEAASTRLQSAIAALDSLLATVPAPIFNQAQVHAVNCCFGCKGWHWSSEAPRAWVRASLCEWCSCCRM